jgi:hypothetical protein
MCFKVFHSSLGIHFRSGNGPCCPSSLAIGEGANAIIRIERVMSNVALPTESGIHFANERGRDPKNE